GTIPVLDTMTGQAVGRLGNLSQTGMLLIASQPLMEDALYQLRFSLPLEEGDTAVEVGTHLLWIDSASAPGQYWSGFRFIAVAPAQTRHIRAWIDAPGGTFE